MTRFLKRIITIWSLCSSVGVSFFSQNSFGLSKFEFKNQLDLATKNASKNRNISAKFLQEFYSALREKVTNSSGEISLNLPNSFRFEIKSPRNEIYISNGKDFWKYDPDFHHAQKFKKKLNELDFISILGNLELLKKIYKVSEWDDGEAKSLGHTDQMPEVNSELPPKKQEGVIFLRLEPTGDKQQKILYASIQVSTGYVLELRIVQLNGNRTRFTFQQFSRDAIDSNMFAFVPPEGTVVDIIE